MARAVGDGAKVVSAAIRHEKEERQRRPLRLVRFCGEVGSKRRSEEKHSECRCNLQSALLYAGRRNGVSCWYASNEDFVTTTGGLLAGRIEKR